MAEIPGDRSPAERLHRGSSADLDAILGLEFRVLDEGFVRVVDYMGSDASIVQAARVSYGAGTKRTSDDEALIRYLIRHAHTTPLEMCEIKLHVRVPMDCWRQWIRHRTASVNEYSTRYSLAIDACQKTAHDGWRVQSSGNRQGSQGLLPPEIGARLSAVETQLHENARAAYEDRLAAGVAREQARKDLPLSNYTEAYWKIDLHNLLHFLGLRMDSHAQFEIREYARLIGNEIVSRWCPLAWRAFVDYRLGELRLSRLEVEVLGLILRGDPDAAIAKAEAIGWLKLLSDGSLVASRERAEFELHLLELGVRAPWAPVRAESPNL
ncbi:MAG: FAD-dependent thymidylate synthase [Deltaproteobacteria bacterium]|nr:FAD-dependent thymidylate synthase [Deltaproteobacteria bacterium]